MTRKEKNINADRFNRCSDYDKLSVSGRRGFHLDSQSGYSSDHVYPGKPVLGCFARTLHVWCGRQLLHPYQERIKYFLAVLLSVFAMAFPVYALPDEMLLENAEYIDVGIYESGITNDGSDDYFLNYGPVLRSPSVNPDVPFRIYGYELIRVSDTQFQFSLRFEGTPPANPLILNLRNSNGVSFTRSLYSPDFISTTLGTSTESPTTLVSLTYDSGGQSVVLMNYNIVLTPSMIGTETGGDISTISYLSIVGQVFSWILASLGTFISFLLGNSFLAVMLCLFLAGTVVSFFVRIRG